MPPEEKEFSTEAEDLKPKKPSNRAPEGIRTFTVCRQSDETGISDLLNYACAPGHYCPKGTLELIPCPVGAYQAYKSGRGAGDCQPCTPGNFCSQLGTVPAGSLNFTIANAFALQARALQPSHVWLLNASSFAGVRLSSFVVIEVT